MIRLMTAVAFVALLAGDAPAQQAGLSAQPAFDPNATRLDPSLKCRLGLVNPRGCVPSGAQPGARDTGGTRPTGGPSGGPRPQRRP